MAAPLDLHPDAGHPVLAGVAEVHALLDAMHAGARRAAAVRGARRGWSPRSIAPAAGWRRSS